MLVRGHFMLAWGSWSASCSVMARLFDRFGLYFGAGLDLSFSKASFDLRENL